MRTADHILKLIAVAAVIASLLPLGAKAWWGFDLASHFRVQYVVLDVLLLVLLALRQEWLWSAALAACAAWSALWVAPYVPFGPSAAAAASPTVAGATIKLLSANVLFRNHSATRLLEIVRDESPDVVLLVEYTPEWSRMSDDLRTTYPYHLEAPAIGAFGIALFSRIPFDSVRSFALGPTTAIEAHVRTPGGPLTLFGVHLRSPTTPRRSAVPRPPARLAGRASRRGEGTGRRHGRLQRHALFAALRRLAREDGPHRHAPRPHSEPELACVLANRRHPHRSLRGEPRHRDRRASQLAELRLRSLSDPHRARVAGSARAA